MMDFSGRMFTVDNGRRYSVIESVVFNDRSYVYLINVDDDMDSMFQEISVINGELVLSDIDSELFSGYILDLFVNKLESE